MPRLTLAFVCVLLVASVSGGVASATRQAPPGARVVPVKLLAHDVSRAIRARPHGHPQATARRTSIRVLFRSPLARLLPPHRRILRTLLAVPPSPTTLAVFGGIPGPLGPVTYAPNSNGDIGLTQYVQAVNFELAVFSRAAPQYTLLGLVSSSQFWAGLGNPADPTDPARLCSSNPAGDPVVQYDRLADRWVFSEFAFAGGVAPFVQCVAVSTSSDATGTWYRYAFQASSAYFPDSPKLGIWPDGYYFSFNQFASRGGAFAGGGAFALERIKMLMGADAQARYADLRAVNPDVGGMEPATVESAKSPAAGPELYLQSNQSVITPNIELWGFAVDWTTNVAGSSTFEPTTQLAVSPFNSSFFCGIGVIYCIDQPPVPAVPPALLPTPAPALDQGAAVVDSGKVVIPQLSYHLAYLRDPLTGTEHLVATQTVNVGSPRAGVRWYELRNITGLPTGWSLADQGDYAPAGDNRFMSSGGIDNSGDVVLAYSLSSLNRFPSLRYTGRSASDGYGLMTVPEQSLFAGSVQQLDSKLWGAYSSLSLDPLGLCNFWFTGEHAGAFGWGTSIGEFSLDTCVPALLAATNPELTGDSTTSTPMLREAQTITATPGTWNNSTGVTGQWRRCDQYGFACIDILGQTGLTHVFSALDAAGDRTVRYQEIASNGILLKSKASSLPTATIIQSLPPVNVVRPLATGTAQVGQTLSTTDGTWTSSSPVTFSYSWRRCMSSTSCVSILGANSSSYVLDAADLGDTVDVIVSATNTGAATFANADPTVAVAAAPAGTVGTGGTGGTGGSGGGAGSPDLAVSGFTSAAAPLLGDVVTFLFTVSDKNAVLAQGLVVNVTLSSGLQYWSSTADRGSGCLSTSATTLKCNLDFLSANALSGHLQIATKATATGPQTLTATASDTQGDSDPSNNTVSLSVVVPPAADTSGIPTGLNGNGTKTLPDKKNPTSHPIASKGNRGQTAKLRFRIYDDRGVAKAVATVRRNGKVFSTARTGLGTVAYGSTYFVGWHVPGKAPKGRYTFCVVAIDRAGNHSPSSCAPLALK